MSVYPIKEPGDPTIDGFQVGDRVQCVKILPGSRVYLAIGAVHRIERDSLGSFVYVDYGPGLGVWSHHPWRLRNLTRADGGDHAHQVAALFGVTP